MKTQILAMALVLMGTAGAQAQMGINAPYVQVSPEPTVTPPPYAAPRHDFYTSYGHGGSHEGRGTNDYWRQHHPGEHPGQHADETGNN